MKLSGYDHYDLDDPQYEGQKISQITAKIKSQNMKEQALKKLFASPISGNNSKVVSVNNKSPLVGARTYNLLVDYKKIKPEFQDKNDNTIKAIAFQVPVINNDPETAVQKLEELIQQLCLPEYMENQELFNSLYDELCEMISSGLPASQPRIQRKTANEIAAEKLEINYAKHYDSFSADKKFAKQSQLYDQQIESFKASRAVKQADPQTYSFSPLVAKSSPFPLSSTSQARQQQLAIVQQTEEDRIREERLKRDFHTSDITNQLAAKARQREIDRIQQIKSELEKIPEKKKEDDEVISKEGEVKMEEAPPAEEKPAPPAEGAPEGVEGDVKPAAPKPVYEYKVAEDGSALLPTFEDLVRAKREVLLQERKKTHRNDKEMQELYYKKIDDERFKENYPIPVISEQGHNMQFDIKDVSVRLGVLQNMAKMKIAKNTRDVQTKKDNAQLAIPVWNPKTKIKEALPPPEPGSKTYSLSTFAKLSEDAKVRQLQLQIIEEQTAEHALDPECTFKPEIDMDIVNKLVQSRQERLLHQSMENEGKQKADKSSANMLLSLTEINDQLPKKNENIPEKEIAFFDYLYNKGLDHTARRDKYHELQESSAVIMSSAILTNPNSNSISQTGRTQFIKDLFNVLSNNRTQLSSDQIEAAKSNFAKDMADDLGQLSQVITASKLPGFDLRQFSSWFASQPRTWGK